MFRSFFLDFLLASGMWVTACQSDRPAGILSEGEMEDVLYDYHITQGLASQRPSDSIPFLSHLYRQAVFEKYGIAQADFDRSMEWYARHTSQLSKIYERVGERLGESGGSGSGGRMNIGRDGERLKSDTAQIWQGPPTLLLSSQGVQHYVFQVPADTSYQAGDRIEWAFQVNWHYHEGNRQAVAVLGLCYEGDSVITTTQRITQSGENRLTGYVDRNRKLKSVAGVIYQTTGWAERPRLLLLRNISLAKIHLNLNAPAPVLSTPVVPASAVRKDSVQLPIRTRQQQIRDSLLREDTLRQKGAHFR